MTRRLDPLRFQRSVSVDLRQVNVTNPYAWTCDASYSRYNQTFEMQKSNVKGRAEFLLPLAAIDARSGWFGKDPTLKAGELRQAQDVLETLSKHLSPMLALGLKS